jgi:lanthanide-dependent methanol dehydrogenase
MKTVKMLNHQKLRLRLPAWVVAVAFAMALAGCKHQTQSVQEPAAPGGGIHPYGGALEADDGQWVRATKDYANTR